MKSKDIVFRGLAILGVAALVFIAASFFIPNLRFNTASSPSNLLTIGSGNSAPAAYDRGMEYGQDNSKNLASSVTSAPQLESGRKVVRTASFALLVQNAEDTAQKIHSLAVRLGGYVVSSNVFEAASGAKAGTVTFKIPVARFAEAMDAVRGEALKVDREDQQAQDVTAQYVDYESRLGNLQAQEQQYLLILKQARTVEDTLRVSQALFGVRSEIEAIQGQLKYMDSQIELASITVQLTAEKDVQVWGLHWRPLIVIKQALRDLISGVAGYVDGIIRLVFLLPVIALWLVTILAGAWIVWRIGRALIGRF